ncbi:MFS transporter [Candidatus Odyssella thessalonicensis]|uniref:MFS transporter n=1 Tax=Candidatus Odyssella thessalonicensis TaxID=84647 RepID=UPI000225A956|nr:MFS transporter [Candidatus Odyssella thessalonicensis]
MQAVTSPAPSSAQNSKLIKSHYGWIVWGCAALFYLYEYILRVSPSVMTNEIAIDFVATSTTIGLMASYYYYAYVSLQIPCGVIVDWLGARRVITFSALLCVVGSFMFSYATTMEMAKCARFLMGAGSACAYLSTMKVASVWLKPERFALVAGITMMMGTLGGLFGGAPFAILVNNYGWRLAMLIMAIAGLGVALACWVMIKDSKQGKEEAVESAGLLIGLKAIMRNPQNWLIGIYGGLMYVPLSAFAELWGTPYLMRLYDISNEKASLSSAMVFVGMALGCPLFAALSDRLKSRVKVMSWSALLTIPPFMAVIYIPNLPLELTFALLFLAGLVCGGQILYFAAAKEINDPAYSATTIGFTNAFVMVSGVIFQPLLGVIIDFAWDGLVNLDGTPMYSIGDYQQAMATIPVCMIAAWFVMLFVKETFPAHR